MAKHANYECVPLKSCNEGIISKPVDMQVYIIKKVSLNHWLSSLGKLFVVHVDVVQKMCYTQ